MSNSADPSPQPADVVAAPSAQDKAARGDAVLVDIRRPEEWHQTGMPVDAIGITLEDPAFVDKVAETLSGDLTKPLMLICRTGGRTLRALHLLRDRGFQSVTHVGEGMAGSAHGPGWIARGLPVRQYEG